MGDSAVVSSGTDLSSPFRARAFGAIVCGGFAVGVLDILDATIFFGLKYGVTPIRVLWSVAAGLIGRERAINGGLKTALLGLFLHFLIAFIMATVFYGVSLVLPTLIRHAVIWGMIYGVAAYFVMTYVVVPLSAAPPRPAPPWPVFLNGVIGHALLVGLPIALCARWSAKPRS
ncbi:MAG TPA: hypothetical protein VN920_01385 [Pyrinomonadaceae bacterium]|nr:hypothetical protein [Pyrinomonadaceae bacterium]